MVQFPVVAWGLHRDRTIMLSCSAFYGVYMMSVVSVMFLHCIHQEMMVERAEIVVCAQD